jgi:hypothetical protein
VKNYEWDNVISKEEAENLLKVYLAGAIAGNLKPFWTVHGRLFQKDGQLTEDNWNKAMKIFLAGSWPWKDTGLYDDVLKQKIYVLESFYSMDKWVIQHIPLFKDFLLDSGAFTFMNSKNKGVAVDFEKYTYEYAEFINKHDIKLFFEMDIDSIKGLAYVEKLRKILEKETGKKPIPVWHLNRGKQYFIDTCKNYPYVAIGGIAGNISLAKKIHPFFPWFIQTAHDNKAKIHALGYTDLKGLAKYHFDSVDSTAWLAGNQFGHIYIFDGKTMRKVNKKQGQRMTNTRGLALHNFTEWVKFQKYAERHL